MQGSFYLDRDRFLSTPSARRATIQIVAHRWPSCYFYPRPPRGGRHGRPAILQRHGKISIHALREEGDWLALYDFMDAAVFLSTPSARRATAGRSRLLSLWYHFYPRPPRGGRRVAAVEICFLFGYFYPRPPRGGRHEHQSGRPGQRQDFYPRPPRGGRRFKYVEAYFLEPFLSTPSARRATTSTRRWIPGYSLFLSTPSARRATGVTTTQQMIDAISIHALREEGDVF